MDLKQLRQRWNRNLAQAEHFSETDNLTDALARARLVVAEVETELTRTADPTATKKLEATRVRASRTVAAYEETYRAWQERIRDRKASFLESEEEAYQEPLAVKGFDRSPAK